MDEKRRMLRHFLATLAYRTRKSLQDAPTGFAGFRAAPGTRTPHQIVLHMTSVLGYARTFFVGGQWQSEKEDDLQKDVGKFYAMLESLKSHLEQETPFRNTTPERMLQGPFADAMSHVGQLAMLRRIFGAPVPPENFIMASIDGDNVGPHQADPVSPDTEWRDAEGRPQK